MTMLGPDSSYSSLDFHSNPLIPRLKKVNSLFHHTTSCWKTNWLIFSSKIPTIFFTICPIDFLVASFTVQVVFSFVCVFLQESFPSPWTFLVPILIKTMRAFFDGVKLVVVIILQNYSFLIKFGPQLYFGFSYLEVFPSFQRKVFPKVVCCCALIDDKIEFLANQTQFHQLFGKINQINLVSLL